MKTIVIPTCLLALLALPLLAEEPDPSIAGLEQTAEKFVTAYNLKDAAALAALFSAYHLSPAGDDDAPKQSTAYTAALLKNADGVWQNASSRGLKDVTEAAGQLADLAEALKGEWTYTGPEGLRLLLGICFLREGR